MEVDIGQVERHGAALGDLLRFVQQPRGLCGIAAQCTVVERGGEQGFREMTAERKSFLFACIG